MPSPNISIVIPCYNKRPYVAATIESALAQGDGCEVVVVDDGSTDGSLEVVKSYEGRIIWETGPNRGACAARNRGLDLAKGDYIQFLDADDILPPEKIARQREALEVAGPDAMATCAWAFLQDDGRVDPPSPRPYWRDYDTGLELLLDMWRMGGHLPTLTWLVPRTLIDASGPWNPNLAADQDGEFYGRLLTRAAKTVFCTDPHVLYRTPPPGSISRDKSRCAGLSRMSAFEAVAQQILAQRSDRMARCACLSRVRRTAYALRGSNDIVAAARLWERRLAVFDFSPALPRGTRCLVGLFGIKIGLKLRQLARGN